jgi:hypothetical protein
MPPVLSAWLKRCLYGFAALAVIGGMSSQAQAATGQHFMNWYERHTMYTSRCNMRADVRGQYGRTRQYDTWCMTNRRFSQGAPDRPWQAAYPWDRGRMNDRGR